MFDGMNRDALYNNQSMKGGNTMRRQYLIKTILLAFFFLVLPEIGFARDISPVVSTDWLDANLANPRLTVLDVRKVEEYREGHIPGAVSAFYGSWAFKKGELYTEMPDLDDLFELIGCVGVDFNSLIVVVGKTDTPRESYHSGRVACTLLYAGIENVAILDGGYNKWTREKKALSTATADVFEMPFTGKVNTAMIADKEYVGRRLGKVLLLDVREPDIFSGKRKLDCIAKSGHMPGAINLPTSCAFNDDGTFKSKEALAVIAEIATGKDRSREIVTYCDTGQCCPTWSYLLKELLGYSNVRVYDGAMQEWTQDPRAVMVK
jgi:thiosulfate/3-mercaptopyruvate sulfurtransferase